MASPGKKSFLLRLDPQVWTQLERLAAADLRSVNAEVEFLLREGLKRRGMAPPGEGRATEPRATPPKTQTHGEQDG